MPPFLKGSIFKRFVFSSHEFNIRKYWRQVVRSHAKDFLGSSPPRWVRILALLTLGKLYRLKGRPFQNPRCRNPIPDGCTWVPNFNFRDVCDQHDIAYAAGGSAEDRRRADKALRQGIVERGHPVLAVLYYGGVRLMGMGAFCFEEPFLEGHGLLDDGDFDQATDMIG